MARSNYDVYFTEMALHTVVSCECSAVIVVSWYLLRSMLNGKFIQVTLLFPVSCGVFE
jgi:hypothetical protein